MKCDKCGREYEGAECPYCAIRAESAAEPEAAPVVRESAPDETPSDKPRFATAALVLGILGVVFAGCTIIPGMIMGAIAIVFGALELHSSRRGVAVAGLVLGVVAVVLGAALIALIAILAQYFVQYLPAIIINGALSFIGGLV